MFTELEQAAHRFSVFAQQVIEPAVYGAGAPLTPAVVQSAEPMSYAEARRREYRPVERGWCWGPVWATAWFRLTGTVPGKFAGQPVALRFSSGTEALLWRDGVPHCGFDPNHDMVVLFESARGGEEIELYIEAACNRPLGATMFWWDTAELRQRWESPTPGQLERCEIAVYRPEVWRLWRAFDFARQLVLTLAPESPRARALLEGLRRVTNMLDAGQIEAQAKSASQLLHAALRGEPSTRTRCFAVGQGHLDTAWLWRLRESRRKCLRTFATALRLMEQYPDFRFLWSQAQQYAWVQEDAPQLFEAVAARVRESRWEAGGAMWVEPDCNVPSGESLVRQILHGTRFWEQAFGPAGRQTFLYLPDTFGFNAALPQIMALAGLDTFVTNKLAWNDTNEFPHTTFRWRGLDGTEVLAHLTPGRDYNAQLTPAELQRGEKETVRKSGVADAAWLQPLGFGDGGGGPTAGMLENAQLARACEGLPEVRLQTARALCDELHRQRAQMQAEGRDLPVWDGELYLEYHRGVYTTQAWLKRANRRAEQGLRIAEWLTAVSVGATKRRSDEGAQRRLADAWRLVLLNQFHDILPGSSITAVYDDARAQYAEIEASYQSVIADGVRAWAAAADTRGMRRPALVFNPCSTPRSGPVECEGEWLDARDVPALGAAVVERASPLSTAPVTVHGGTLSNGLLSATIDETGRIVSLRRGDVDREAGARQAAGARAPLNQLVLYEDRPRFWDAWDLDREYLEKPTPVTGGAESWQVVESGPWRGVIEVSRPLGRASRITQRFALAAGSPRLDIQTTVDWHEERTILRALFPVDVRARQATYEIPFGCLERPTHRNTPWEQAMYEVCAQRWMDLSEPGFGVALLNDGKYGHSCHESVLGLSLLRSPNFPDPRADRGTHEFTYSLMPHSGDWRAAGADREAEALNTPLWAVPLPGEQTGRFSGSWAPFTLEIQGAAGVQVTAVKRAEDDDRLIVRLVETHGGAGRVRIRWNAPVQAVELVDLLERALDSADVVHDGGVTTVALHPFHIVTLVAT
jgi:alpha-mannosidase